MTIGVVRRRNREEVFGDVVSHHPIFRRVRLAVMTRATRFLAYSSVVTAVYFVFLLSVIPVPLLSKETADQLLPVVSITLEYAVELLS